MTSTEVVQEIIEEGLANPDLDHIFSDDVGEDVEDDDDESMEEEENHEE